MKVPITLPLIGYSTLLLLVLQSSTQATELGDSSPSSHSLENDNVDVHFATRDLRRPKVMGYGKNGKMNDDSGSFACLYVFVILTPGGEQMLSVLDLV